MGQWIKALLVVLLAGLGGGVWWWFTPHPETWLRRGRLALQQADFEQVEYLAGRLETGGYRDHALLLRGEERLQLGQCAEALALFNQIRDQGDLRLQAVAPSGQCLLQLGELREAERAFSYLLSQRPRDVDAHRGLAAVYYDQGALALAVSHCDQWAELLPQDGRPFRLKGLISKDLGQFQQAVDSYQLALARDLKEHVKDEVRLELAECWLQLKDYPRVLATLDSLPSTSRLASRVPVLRAEALRGLGRASEALALAAKASASGKDPHALRLQAQLLLETERAPEAVPLLEKAEALDPQDYETQHLLAQAYRRCGQDRQAQEHRQQANQIRAYRDELSSLTLQVMNQPRDPGLHRRMAELYDKLNLPEMAARSRALATSLARTPLPAVQPGVSP